MVNQRPVSCEGLHHSRDITSAKHLKKNVIFKSGIFEDLKRGSQRHVLSIVLFHVGNI